MQINLLFPLPKTDTRLNLYGVPFMSWGQHTLDAKKEDLSSLAIFGGQL